MSIHEIVDNKNNNNNNKNNNNNNKNNNNIYLQSNIQMYEDTRSVD